MKYFIFIFCVSVAIVMCSCVQSNNVEDIRLDYRMSKEFGLKEAQDIVKEMVTFMDKEIELGKSGIARRDSDGFDEYYFSRREDEKRLEEYHRNYLTDETYTYLTQMYEISRYSRGMAQQVERDEKTIYGLRYSIDTQRDFRLKSAGNNELHIEVPFIYHVIISDTLPKEDYGDIVFTKDDVGHWRISKISHWYNDIVFYGLGKRMYLLDNYCKTKSDYEQFVERFGVSSSGDRIPMDILQISYNEILPNSDKLKFGEFINGEFPELFTKLTAYLAMEEIYARHGKPYEKGTFEYEYFNKATAWYKENSDFSENMLNDIEIYNISKLSDYIDGL